MPTSGIGSADSPLASARPISTAGRPPRGTREHRLGLRPLDARASLDFAGERCAEKRERGRGRGVQEREARMVPGLDENAGADGVNRVDGGPGPHDVRGCPPPEDDRLEEVPRPEHPRVDLGVPIGPLIRQDRQRLSRPRQQRYARESSSPDHATEYRLCALTSTGSSGWLTDHARLAWSWRRRARPPAR